MHNQPRGRVAFCRVRMDASQEQPFKHVVPTVQPRIRILNHSIVPLLWRSKQKRHYGQRIVALGRHAFQGKRNNAPTTPSI